MSAPCDELEPTGPESPVSTTSWWMVELATAYSEKESENKAALALLTIGHDRRCPKPGQIQTTSTSCIFYRVTGASDDGPPVRCRDEISLRLRGVHQLNKVANLGCESKLMKKRKESSLGTLRGLLLEIMQTQHCPQSPEDGLITLLL
ncbi:hypothetical protein AXG93_4142s1090 [Marchantia polymorpha subsp. ruderalis]|uniref:Uncharacterized protein n=1 Tax=Marchantia polymorpha subsp. ruderalis TaxID=1480154 RepID=A0A176WMD3_MARPO|nr:hypothetical protein AXG93_4142s1090 [Marchantia polymorpha subsp. ruderalis]